jgi:hypothetical protein
MEQHPPIPAGAVGPLPFLGTVLTTFGLLMLVAGIVERHSPAILTCCGASSTRQEMSVDARWVSSAAGVNLMTKYAGNRTPHAPHALVITPRRPHPNGDDRIMNALFAPAPRSSSQSLMPVEGGDLRQALLDVSVGQQSGRWVYSCPCPMRQVVHPVDEG